MSVIQTPVTITLLAAADLSAKQFFLVKIDDANEVDLAGDGQAAVGVLLNKPKAGQPALVQIGGLAKVVAAGALNAPVRIMSTAAGKATTSTTGKYVVGVTTQDASGDGSIVECVLSPVPHVVP
jgi:hypothetical protein